MNPPAILFSAQQIQERVGMMARTIASAPLRPDIAMPPISCAPWPGKACRWMSR